MVINSLANIMKKLHFDACGNIVGLTDRTLRRAFNREYGMTISAYVENTRLEYARGTTNI